MAMVMLVVMRGGGVVSLVVVVVVVVMMMMVVVVVVQRHLTRHADLEIHGGGDLRVRDTSHPDLLEHSLMVVIEVES